MSNDRPHAPLAAGGSDTAATLGALRVVELGHWLAAPSACALLADLGAEVIKVEPPEGDPLRKFPASMRGGDDRSPGFSLLNRRKKSVVIDLATDAGRVALDRLLGTADVFVTNMRPTVLDRFKLGPASLTARFPRLIYAILTGQGLSGPDKDRPGFDTGAFWARGGLLHQITADGSEPLAPTGGYGDLVTSLSLFSAILVALLERVKTGQGGVVDTSLLQTAAWLLSGDVAALAAFGRPPKARPRAKSTTPLVNTYKTSDSRWIFLIAVEAGRHLERVCRAIGRPELAADARFSTSSALRQHAADLIAVFDEAFARHPLSYWSERLAAEDVWWEKVATPAELISDPQLAANRMTGEIRYGDSSISAVLAPFRVFGRTADAASAAPELGADTADLVPTAESGSTYGSETA
jgi:crotonobetainyl-CoA:carnitine CoA-transferase CaiB-like acyl-CoA transferase